MEKPNKTNKSQYILLAVGVIVAVLAIVAYATGIFSFPSSSEKPSDDAVASVNGEEISRQDLETRMTAAGAGQDQEQNILAQLINEELIRQDAKTRGLGVLEEEIESALASIVANLGSEEAFEQALASEDTNQAELRVNIQNQLLLNRYVEAIIAEQNIAATDEEVQTLYDQVAESQEDLEPLEEIRDQVAREIIQQKLQQVIPAILDQLRAEANIEILI